MGNKEQAGAKSNLNYLVKNLSATVELSIFKSTFKLDATNKPSFSTFSF